MKIAKRTKERRKLADKIIQRGNAVMTLYKNMVIKTVSDDYQSTMLKHNLID